ncbi:DNA-binding protein [Metabacillus litoralis]|uniref:DNA-binding protein n=1 Tax=Metabacillus litoralis TaxID=152268 RepID=A0A5C6V5P7_9BACI|nr:DNA-binding protein [Metabacillus litoralis]
MRTKVGHFVFQGELTVDPDNKTNMKIKPPTTYREQVEIFKTRNLHIKNSESAENYLQRVNYYRLSAYAITLKDPLNKENYKDNSTFEELTSLYEFDRRLRLLLLGVLETIEIAFRTHISYETAHKYGPLGYKDKENFTNEKFHKESLDELDTLISRSRKGELFIEHHFKNYSGHIPIWAAIEVTSFGYISKFYRNLNEDLKKHIAKVYYNVPYLYLESWLQTLSNVRNVCAHYGRLYNKKLTFKPRLFKEDIRRFNNQKVYAAIYIIQRLLTRVERKRFLIELETLIQEYEEHIDYSHIGFPNNWRELLNNKHK